MVFPLLFMLIFGMVTAGVAYNRSNSLHNGAREASRYGAMLVFDAAGRDAALANIADVAKEAATGDLIASAPNQRVCVAVVAGTAASPTIVRRVVETSGSRVYSDATCFSDSRSDERIQVSVQRDTTIEAVVFTRAVTLSATSVSRYERGL